MSVSTIAFSKEPEPIQKLFIGRMGDYSSKQPTPRGPADAGPGYQHRLGSEFSS
ncbi:ATP synthase-coupling factor 6, mitochondrial [Lemmus lemmus]